MEGINLSKADPTATLQFDFKGATGIRKKTMKAGIGFNLYDNSGGLDEYQSGFVVKFIDGRDNSVEFLNGIKIYAGDVIGKVSEDQPDASRSARPSSPTSSGNASSSIRASRC